MQFQIHQPLLMTSKSSCTLTYLMDMLFPYLVTSFFPVLQGDEGTDVWVCLIAATKLS